MKYAHVIVDISLQKLDRTYTYSIPAELTDAVDVGVKVKAPFGNRTLTGYVIEISDVAEFDVSKIKDIIEVETKALPVTTELIKLASFMSKRYGCTMNQALKTVLPAKRQIAKKKVRVEQTEIEDIEVKEVVLNNEQQLALDGIIKNYPRTALIYGITGSGKTEIYMRLIDEMIARGKKSILLIPEIALTFQNLQRFHARYKDRVGVLNSKLSAGERYRIIERAMNGEVDVVIGPRSALFTPFDNLGLIIIDEEHDGAYFSEKTPRYRASEVALERARLSGACVVLGSATPLVDDYKKALDGEYDLYKLNRRAVETSELPKVSVVDLREEFKSGNKTIFSRELAEDINDRLERKEQIMLFLNRRGYSGMISCRSCGEVITCPHCDVSLTYHRGGRLICHYCGHEEMMPKACPKCTSPYIAGFGIGTEKVEAMVNKYFPKARTIRMDADTTSGKDGHSKILSKFNSGKADILIGTQMIVKGHDFPNVTLVGILAADLSLYSDDYRASEVTFELITQAAGRAGRADSPGEVVVQTYNPDHPVILAAAQHNYEKFYEEEISFRKLLGYPPEGAMLSLLVTADTEEAAGRDAGKLISETRKKFAEYDLQIIGPSDAGHKKIQDRYRCAYYIKYSDKNVLLKIQDAMIEKGLSSAVTIDII